MSDAAKRAFDLVAACLGLVLLSPLLFAISIAVRASSPGPVIYRQIRVGRNGRPFRLYKFRTMRVDADRTMRLTTLGDPRITKVGAFLRRSRMDEIPQLWNVVRGDMSIVGPRPEVPEFVDARDPAWELTLAMRPGLTAPASLAYLAEDEILAKYSDPVDGYRREILPTKLALNDSYARTRSFLGDLRIIFASLAAIVRRDGSRARGQGEGRVGGK